jgi:hypothetical protein
MCYIVGLMSRPIEIVEILVRIEEAAERVESRNWDDCGEYVESLRRIYGSVIRGLPENGKIEDGERRLSYRRGDRKLLVIRLECGLAFTGELQSIAFLFAANRSFRRSEARGLLEVLGELSGGRIQTGAVDELGYLGEEYDPDPLLMRSRGSV